jgi:hypothetical protein
MRCGQTCREAAVAVKPAPVDDVGVRGAERPTRLLTTAAMQLKHWQQTTRSATCISSCSRRRPRRQPHTRLVVRLGKYRRAEQVAAAVVAASLGASGEPRPPIIIQQQRMSTACSPAPANTPESTSISTGYLVARLGAHHLAKQVAATVVADGVVAGEGPRARGTDQQQHLLSSNHPRWALPSRPTAACAVWSHASVNIAGPSKLPPQSSWQAWAPLASRALSESASSRA